MDKIRVLIADDHTVFREGLRALLNYYDDIEVVGEAQDGEEVILLVKELHPDIVLMDIAMPNMNGLEATRRICQECPSTRVLILTQYDDRQYILSLLRMGASGYVLKQAAGSDLLAALRAVSRGEIFLDPGIMTTVVKEIRSPGENDAIAPVSLTSREHELLQHIFLGQTSSQIAALLSLSVKTVEWHRTNLMSKLGVHNIADLLRTALELDLIDASTLAGLSHKSWLY
jgi:DNA-binding NarL/FixJ family response regulator